VLVPDRRGPFEQTGDTCVQVSLRHPTQDDFRSMVPDNPTNLKNYARPPMDVAKSPGLDYR
jgi:hypothetical protein